ncbi:hypothetical protein [Pseudalkalibacillus sp. SCS-8]|uniref:hypothetical protein n=1 Tax=Pseudalkalibacillus nanhaiensis TaxID=3115291 RepID=UPI0032DB6C6C
MSLFDSDCNDKKRKKNRCEGCVCDQLKDLEPGTPVFVRTIAGGLKSSIKGRFLCFDKETCCATFSERVFSTDMTTVIDCNDIVSLAIGNDEYMENMNRIMNDVYEALRRFTPPS